MPDGRNDGLLRAEVPLHHDGDQAGILPLAMHEPSTYKGGFEETEQGAVGQDAGDVEGEYQSKSEAGPYEHGGGENLGYGESTDQLRCLIDQLGSEVP